MWTSHRIWQAINLSFEAILYTQEPFQKLNRKTGIRPVVEFLFFFSRTNFVIVVLGQEERLGYTFVWLYFLKASNLVTPDFWKSERLKYCYYWDICL